MKRDKHYPARTRWRRVQFKMSEYEYNNLLYKISKRLDKIHVGEQLLVICRGKLAARNEENIPTFSLFKELEEKGFLSPDRLNVLKAMLKGVEEWALLEEVEKLEAKRKEYNDLLERVIQVLDGLNDLERLLSICGRKITEARQSSILNVRSLFKELESNDCLGIDCLDTLKEILNQTHENNLLKEVEEFEQRQNHELKSERRKGIVPASFVDWFKWGCILTRLNLFWKGNYILDYSGTVTIIIIITT